MTTLEDYFDFLDPNDIRIKGHRIGIESVLYEYLFRASTPTEIAERFPSLTLEEIYATLLYYHHNKPAVDQYLEDWLEYGRQAREAQAQKPEIMRLRAKLQAARLAKFG